MTGRKLLPAGLGLVATLAWAAPAAAYIGPGAGLSLLGALWGVFAAIFAALLFLLIWPLRRLLRRNRQAPAPVARDRGDTATLVRREQDPRVD